MPQSAHCHCKYTTNYFQRFFERVCKITKINNISTSLPNSVIWLCNIRLKCAFRSSFHIHIKVNSCILGFILACQLVFMKPFEADFKFNIWLQQCDWKRVCCLLVALLHYKALVHGYTWNPLSLWARNLQGGYKASAESCLTSPLQITQLNVT